MSVKPGDRAARARTLVSGRAWDIEKPKRTTVILLPGLLDLAEQYGICAPMGRNGVKSIGEYIQDHLIADIREYEKKRREKYNREESDQPGQ